MAGTNFKSILPPLPCILGALGDLFLALRLRPLPEEEDDDAWLSVEGAGGGGGAAGELRPLSAARDASAVLAVETSEISA